MVKINISKTERQLNLTYALMMRGARGMTLKDISQLVPGYGYVFEPDDALRKLIGRDMRDIQRSGIEIQQSRFQDASENHDFRYAIADNSFNWPKGFEVNANQTRLLELAANCWNEASLNEELTNAMTRVAALGEAPNREEMRELLPSFRPMDPTFPALAEAIENSQRVRIKYRKAGVKTAEVREISPWKFLNIEGEWIIQAWSHKEPEGFRNFLLKRIVDKKPVLLEGKDAVYRAPQGDDLEAALDDLNQFRDKNVAVIRVTPETAAWSHFEMEYQSEDIKTLRFMDVELLAATLRRYANQIEILAPETLKTAVNAGLEKLVATHA